MRSFGLLVFINLVFVWEETVQTKRSHEIRWPGMMVIGPPIRREVRWLEN